MSVMSQKFEEIANDLPPQVQAEIINFAEYLREKWRKKNEEKSEQKRIPGLGLKDERVLGLHEGKGWISDDFDDPLPDEFWFGEDFGLINKDEPAA